MHNLLHLATCLEKTFTNRGFYVLIICDLLQNYINKRLRAQFSPCSTLVLSHEPNQDEKALAICICLVLTVYLKVYLAH